MAKIGVLLSGCGKLDGAEVHESVLALLAISKSGNEYFCLAPDKEQRDVVDHGTGQPMEEKRNIRIEAARIAREEVIDIASVDPTSFDALVIPGGFGAAKNLCTFAFDGVRCDVDSQVERLLKETHQAGKPICAICIAPALIARVFGDKGVTVTIGNDADTAGAIEKMGASHEACAVDDFVVDEANRIVTTPAYMLGPTVADVASGIEAAVNATLKML